MERSYHFLAHSTTPVLFKGEPLAGATLTMDLKFFRGTEEVPVEDKVLYVGGHIYAPSKTVQVCFDRDLAFRALIDNKVVDFYKKGYGIDRVEFSIPPDGYEIDVDISEGLCEGRQVTEAEFKDFLKAHADLFDIPDNQSAQEL